MASEWNLFVKKIYEEGKKKDSNYEFKQALKDASKRKSEMKHMSLKPSNTKKNKKMKKSRSRMIAGGGKSRGRRSRRRN